MRTIQLGIGSVVLLVAAGCQKQGPLPGQSDVPPPGYGAGNTQGACEVQVEGGSMVLASVTYGWAIALPGNAWDVDCSDATRVTAKLSSNLGESLLLTVTLVEGVPENEREHLDAIHLRAKSVLPRAGARLAKPRFIVASSGSEQKTVFVYQVLADAFEKEQLVSYHGWAVVRTRPDSAFEFHLNATSRKRLDWPQELANVLANSGTVKR